MSIREEIRLCMSDATRTGDGCFRARFRFPADFTAFQGHFPGRPVLPGLCLIQAALVACESGRREKARLREIVSVKFFAPIAPETDVFLDGVESPLEQAECSVKATVRDGARKLLARLSLRVAFLA